MCRIILSQLSFSINFSDDDKERKRDNIRMPNMVIALFNGSGLRTYKFNHTVMTYFHRIGMTIVGVRFYDG